MEQDPFSKGLLAAAAGDGVMRPKGGVTCLAAVDLTEDGRGNLVVGRDDGALEVTKPRRACRAFLGGRACVRACVCMCVRHAWSRVACDCDERLWYNDGSSSICMCMRILGCIRMQVFGFDKDWQLQPLPVFRRELGESIVTIQHGRVLALNRYAGITCVFVCVCVRERECCVCESECVCEREKE